MNNNCAKFNFYVTKNKLLTRMFVIARTFVETDRLTADLEFRLIRFIDGLINCIRFICTHVSGFFFFCLVCDTSVRLVRKDKVRYPIQ